LELKIFWLKVRAILGSETVALKKPCDLLFSIMGIGSKAVMGYLICKRNKLWDICFLETGITIRAMHESRSRIKKEINEIFIFSTKFVYLLRFIKFNHFKIIKSAIFRITFLRLILINFFFKAKSFIEELDINIGL